MTQSASGTRSLRRLLKQFFVYGLGSALFPLVSLILLPIFTKGGFLSPDDFGIIALYYVGSSILVFFMSLGVPHSAMVRLFYDSKEDTIRNGFVGSTAFILLTWGALLTVGLRMLAPWAGKLLFEHGEYEFYWHMGVISAYISTWNAFFLNLLRILERPRVYVITSLSNLVFVVGLNLLFVVVLDLGVEGALSGYVAGNFCVVFVQGLILLRRRLLVWSWAQVKELIFYALPILPLNLGAWAMSMFDRYLIRVFVSLGDLGIYSIGTRLANTTQTLLLTPFRSVWPPHIYGIALENKEDARAELSRIHLYFWIVGVSFVLLLGLFAKEAVLILTTEEYLRARFVVPLLALALVLMELSSLTAGALHIAKKPKYVSSEYFKIVPISVGLNLLLLPRIGIFGAAISAVISYAVLHLLYLLRAQKVFPIPFRVRGLLLTFVYAIVVYCAGLLIDTLLPVWIAAATKVVLFAGFVGLVFYAGAVSANERKQMLEFAINILRRRKKG